MPVLKRMSLESSPQYSMTLYLSTIPLVTALKLFSKGLLPNCCQAPALSRAWYLFKPKKNSRHPERGPGVAPVLVEEWYQEVLQ